MSNGHLKITDEKVVFNHTKSGRKDTIKGSDIELVNWQRLAGVWGIRMFTKDGALHRLLLYDCLKSLINLEQVCWVQGA